MNPHRRALIQIHICVVLWGITAILGKLITLHAMALVWWRDGDRGRRGRLTSAA